MKKTSENLLLADFEKWLHEEAVRQAILCTSNPTRGVDQMTIFTNLHHLSHLIYLYKEGVISD